MKMKKILAGGCALALFAMIESCSASKNAADNADSVALAGNWYISTVNDSTVNTQLEEWPYLDLDTQKGSVTGYLGCNRVMGSFTYTGKGAIQFNDLATTRMMCPEISLEDAITVSLNQARHYAYNKVTGTLTLTSADGKQLIVMTRISPRTAVDLRQSY